ncbi:MAG: ADP-ribosylglycohydrolase family protein [Prevotella sp.]|nr:ADP-ribosylglycohydrolase family protein [Prevotella sp.]
MDENKSNKVLGCLFGQAAGDALGMGAEFLDKKGVAAKFPNGLRHYDDIKYNIVRKFHPGDYTDDTEMMECILWSLNKEGHYDLMDIAQFFRRWLEYGPADVGLQTASVLRNPLYRTDPLGVSKSVWEESGRTLAGNGGVMRTSVMGVLKGNVEEMAADVCRLTHYDPRCVGSSVIVSMVIHQLIYYGHTMTPEEVIQLGSKYDGSIEYYVQRATDPDIASLMLGEKEKRGYTLKAMGAALWALWHPADFTEGLVTVVNEGGDADTNGAPAGAVLGARFGYDAIPAEYTEGLNRYKDLKRIFEKLLTIIQ